MHRTILITLLFPILFSGCWLTDKRKNEKKRIDTDMINNPSTASGEKNVDLPKMAFKDSIFKFGTISQGEEVQHTFEFTNTGGSPLVIASVEPGCGCTVTDDWPEEPIPPGEGGTIGVTYDSEGHKGTQNRSVSIVANTSPKTTVLYLQGKVVGPGSKPGSSPLE